MILRISLFLTIVCESTINYKIQSLIKQTRWWLGFGPGANVFELLKWDIDIYAHETRIRLKHTIKPARDQMTATICLQSSLQLLLFVLKATEPRLQNNNTVQSHNSLVHEDFKSANKSFGYLLNQIFNILKEQAQKTLCHYLLFKKISQMY